MYDPEEVLTPNFRLQPALQDDVACSDLFMETYFTLDDPTVWYGNPDSEWYLLARIFPDRFVTFPVFTNPHAQRYLSQRHGRIKTIVYELKAPCSLPSIVDEALMLIERAMHPPVWNSCGYGLGLVKELDPISTGLMRIPGIDTMVVTLSNEVTTEASSVKFPEHFLVDMRRLFERTKRKLQEQIRLGKQWHVRSVLLTKLAPKQFPAFVQVNSSGELVEYRIATTKPTPAVVKRQRQESVKAVKESARKIAEDAPQVLLSLHAEIERVTLATMIERFEHKLQQSLNEGHWQKFFEENIFILSLLFSRAVQLLHTQFHAQPAHASGSGAQIGDFLFRELGQPLAIVEIKKPSTPLMLSSSYRNEEVYGPHSELSGAMTQVLYQQSAMRNNWLLHQRHFSDSWPDVIKCVVIAGTTPSGDEQRRCFEIFRHACKDVEVVTFDELLAKLKLLLEHLTPPPCEDGKNL